MKYLVGIDDREFVEREFAIVDASTEDQAIDLFVRHMVITKTSWLENLYGKSVNMCFAEVFWIRRKAGDKTWYDPVTGWYLSTEEGFVENVQTFFAGRQDFAQRYLDWWNSDMSVAESVESNPFPEEMQAYISRHYDWAIVTAIAFDDINKISA